MALRKASRVKEFGLAALHGAHATMEEQRLPWTRVDLFGLTLIVSGAIALIWRLWASGVQSRADMLMGVYRIFELVSAWREGIWYPRLGPDLNFTYGAPLFQFYPPLASYLGLIFHGLGLGYISAAKAVFAVALLLAGIGMYVYARSVFRDRCAGWLSAMMYVTAPYLLLDIYERGAAAETLALALLPWLFWAMRRLLYRGQDRTAFFFSAVLVAAVMLSHNITMLFVLPVVLGYVTLLALFERRLAALLPVVLATGLGLALCAFYWLPAVLEVKYTRAQEFMLGGESNVTVSLLAWDDLIQRTFVVDYQGPQRFRFALRPLLLGAFGLTAIPFLRQRRRYEVALLAAVWLVVMFLQSEFSLWFWQNLPLVRFIQFTWRLYGLASFSVALLIGGIVAVLPLQFYHRWALAGGMTLLALWSSGARLDPARFDIWYEIAETEINIIDLFTRGQDGFPIFSDYQPVGMTTIPMMMTLPQPPDSERLPPAPPLPALRVTEENFVRVQLAVDAPAPFTLRGPRIYFPGWRIYADGRPLPTTASGKFGLVTAEMPAGSYTALIQFEQTPIRQISDLVSLLALVVLGGGAAASWWLRRNWSRNVVVAGLVTALALYLQGHVKPMLEPVATYASFGDEFHLLGYALDKTTWHTGEDLELRLYWFVQQAPQIDYKFFVHVSEIDDSGKVAQVDTMPMFNFSPTTRWETGELKVDRVRLPLEPDIQPGRYRLVIGVYHPETVQNLSVRSNANVLPGDRLAITEVEIVND